MLETGGWSTTSKGAREAFDTAKKRVTGAGVTLRTRADDPAIEAAERAMADALPITRRINKWEGRWPLNTYADTDASKLSGSSQERLRNSLKRLNSIRLRQSDRAARRCTYRLRQGRGKL